MLDMLVLSRARRFTGFHASSFSWYVQEHRCQHGIPVSTTTMPQVSIRRLPHPTQRSDFSYAENLTP